MLLFYQTKRIIAFLASAGRSRSDNAHIRNFKQHVLRKKTSQAEVSIIRKIKNGLLQDHGMLEPTDFGAGTKKKNHRTIAGFTRKAVVSRCTGELLFRMARHYKPDMIIELGTGAGISTLYLALGHPAARCITVEGNETLAKTAAKNFEKAGLGHITIINKSFDDVLPVLTTEMPKNSLVYIDGNHTYDATLRYYDLLSHGNTQPAIIVIDDIHWSVGMNQAWTEIVEDAKERTAVDLFRLGILFYEYRQS